MIEKVSPARKLMLAVTVGTTLALLLTCCASLTKEPDSSTVSLNTSIPYELLEPEALTREQLEALAEVEPSLLPSEEPEPLSWMDAELEAMALTLAGECYDENERDKRLVCEVILNRVSDGSFGDSIIEVLTAENQFEGYWTQSRPVSANDYEVSEQALRDWYDNGCEALSEYIFFCAGDNHENIFRSEF